MGRRLRFLGLGLLCLTSLSTTAAGLPGPVIEFPLRVDSYHDQQIPSLLGKVTGRIQREPLNLVATLIFFCAIVHTFLAGWFLKIAHGYQQSYDAIEIFARSKRRPTGFREETRQAPLQGSTLLFHGRSRSGFRYLVNPAVANAHYPVLVILGILFFLAFVSATRLNQHAIALRPPLLVGFFLAALIIRGGCQEWWIGPVLGSLSKWPLMLAATTLTAFNDNAAITYLASLVPGFSEGLKYVVMAGAVTGGGLTVIANSPNPAGQSILASRFGESGISPLYLFLGALVPTFIAGAAFMLLP